LKMPSAIPVSVASLRPERKSRRKFGADRSSWRPADPPLYADGTKTIYIGPF
jgi:hypothetical protein